MPQLSGSCPPWQDSHSPGCQCLHLGRPQPVAPVWLLAEHGAGHTQHISQTHSQDIRDPMPHRAQDLLISPRFPERPQAGRTMLFRPGSPSHGGAPLQRDTGESLQGSVQVLTSTSDLRVSGCVFRRPVRARAGILPSPRLWYKWQDSGPAHRHCSQDFC